MARKEKFKFDAETLSYDKVEVTWGERLLKSLLVIAPAIVLGFVFQFAFSAWFKSPHEISLEKDNQLLKEQLNINSDRLNRLNDVALNLEKNDAELYRVILNAEPFERNLGTGGTDNSELYASLNGFDFSGKLIKNSKNLKELEKKLYLQSLSHDEIIKLATEKENMLASIPSIQPVANKDLKRVASGYGWRIDPHYHTKRMHWGLDFTASTGTNIYASGNGKVIALEQKKWGYGNSIVIDHGYGYKTRYAHLNAFNVKLGEAVTRGQTIGFVGSTGKSTGAHLHYEVEKNGKKVNPTHYFHSDLTPEEYEKMIEMSTRSNQSFD
jgi:murein DD-endopeptidase MepM/ murein hydrolase activator NlpD